MKMNSSDTVKTQKKTHKTLEHALIFFQAIVTSHLRFPLFITVLLLTPLLIVRISPPCFHGGAAAPNAADPDCPSGRVYVYDLPSTFNADLLPRNCTDLDPWKWQCGVAANRGYGDHAAELRRILPENLSRSWYRTNQFALELIFHDRVLSHRCRTTEPQSAVAFYIPFYAGIAVGKHLWNADYSKRDRIGEMLVQWIKTQRHWTRSDGSDHFTAIGRITWDFRRLTDPEKTWGSTFLNMPEILNVNRFIIEKHPGDPRDIGAPYPTGFHPDTAENLHDWQKFTRDHNRSTLFTFIGATRNRVEHDFRQVLFDYCGNEPGSCRLVDCATLGCSADPSVVLEALLGSHFCLQPKGDSFTRRSVFDCMVAGSVPVFFWNRTAYDQYEWFLPGEPESYSVFIDHEAVRNESGIIKRLLMGFSEEEVRRKREKVIETIPRIVYGIRDDNDGLGGFKDAFDIAFDGVLERIKNGPV